MLLAINGNHDIGWHYEMTPKLKNRFDDTFHTHSVQWLIVNGLNFVTVNSVTMEGDYCQLCAEADRQLKRIGRRLCPEKHCPERNRAVVLTHYPLFKQGLQKCGHDWDTRPAGDLFWDESVQKWNCFHSNATDEILSLLKPRLVFNGHTHYGCITRYGSETIEWTIASFNYRYLFSPTFLLMTINENDYAIRKCYLIHGLLFYFVDLFIISLFLILIFRYRIHMNAFRGYVRVNLAKS